MIIAVGGFRMALAEYVCAAGRSAHSFFSLDVYFYSQFFSALIEIVVFIEAFRVFLVVYSRVFL